MLPASLYRGTRCHRWDTIKLNANVVHSNTHGWVANTSVKPGQPGLPLLICTCHTISGIYLAVVLVSCADTRVTPNFRLHNI
jgi:hypothetical protein